jgi:hypothetical protein
MNNEYGLDADYFKKKLQLMLEGIHNTTPAEMSRMLGQLKEVADFQLKEKQR